MKSTSGRYSINFKEMIEEIKELEAKRGNIDCSDTTATEIVYQRIMKKGGLKEDF